MKPAEHLHVPSAALTVFDPQGGAPAVQTDPELKNPTLQTQTPSPLSYELAPHVTGVGFGGLGRGSGVGIGFGLRSGIRIGVGLISGVGIGVGVGVTGVLSLHPGLGPG